MALVTPQQDVLDNGSYFLEDIFEVLIASGGIDPATNTASTPEDTPFQGRVEFYGSGLSGDGGKVQTIRVYFGNVFALEFSGVNIDYDLLQDAVSDAADGGPTDDIFDLFKGYDWQFDMHTSHAAAFALFGSGGDDDFRTGSASDNLYLDGGGDSVSLGGGDDNIYAGNFYGYAGKGLSVINAGAGTDTLYLGSGFDFVQRGETVDLDGTTTFREDGVKFSVKLRNVENVVGSSFGERISGTDGNNSISGGGGDDKIEGGGGTDILNGGIGADDFIYRSIKDSMAGKTRDVIIGFEHKIDDFDLSPLHPHTRNDKLVFIGADKFDHHVGEVRVQLNDKPGTLHDSTLVQVDFDGNGKADMEIELDALVHLNKGDFIL